MKSTLIEFVRFKALDTGMLRKDDDYLLLAAKQAVLERVMPIDQRPFNKLMKALRYEDTAEARGKALEKLSEHTSFMLGLNPGEAKPLQLEDEPGELQQIDLVVNAAELAGLPFEAASLNDGEPLFKSGGGVVLTRRVRSAFEEVRPEWPTTPRVLFIWSDAGGSVPTTEHRKALLDALKPFVSARAGDFDSVFREIENASASDIEAACQTKHGKFTHVHLLAHGAALEDENDDRFGIALRHPVEGADIISPEQLASYFEPQRASAVVFTLAACDGANAQDSITPEKNLAHALLIGGLPVVVASQLPLTIPGSNILAQRFYRELFAGADVRTALHDARLTLYEERATAGHDWASVVGYVQLREGYEQYLEDVALDSQLAALKNLRDRAEILGPEAGQEAVDRIRASLERKIRELESLLGQKKGQKALDENRGLLASAHKRLGELLFTHGQNDGDRADSRKALVAARDQYREAFLKSPQSHWNGVQYLALDAVLNGKIVAADWLTANRAAEVDRRKAGEFWAHGSLAELALLSRFVEMETDESGSQYLEEMQERVNSLEEPPSYDPYASTIVQFMRYVDRWRTENAFFDGKPDLAKEAQVLVGVLKKAAPQVATAPAEARGSG